MAPPPRCDGDDASLLVVLFETNAALWGEPGPPSGCAASAGLAATLRSLLVFVNAFCLLNAANRLVVFGLHGDGGVRALYESPELAPPGLPPPPPASSPAAALLASLSRCLAECSAEAEAEGRAERRGGTPLAAGLARALCTLHRARDWPLQRRVLCLVGGADQAGQYVGAMNCVFAAADAAVAVDALLLGPSDSALLQQAAALTGGAYARPVGAHAGAAALQQLLAVCAQDGATRGVLRPPPPLGVDFRASCFCHRRAVAVGHVCSVCLAVYCAQRAACDTCGTPFDQTQGGG